MGRFFLAMVVGTGMFFAFWSLKAKDKTQNVEHNQNARYPQAEAVERRVNHIRVEYIEPAELNFVKKLEECRDQQADYRQQHHRTRHAGQAAVKPLDAIF